MKTAIFSIQYVFCGEVVFEEEDHPIIPRAGERFNLGQNEKDYLFQVVAVLYKARVEPQKEFVVKVYLATSRSEDFQEYKNAFAKEGTHG